MKLNVSRTNGTLNIKIVGPVDWAHSENLETEFRKLLSWHFKEAVFNLSSVPSISSSGIGKLLIFYKKASANGSKVRIKGINHKLLHIFQTIKLDQLFPMEQ